MFESIGDSGNRSSRKKYIVVSVLALIALGAIFVVGRPILIPEGPRPEDDVQIGDLHSDRELGGLYPPDPPRPLSVTENGNMFIQFFRFNPDTKEVGLVSSSDLPGLVGVNTQGVYGNTLIDSAGLKSTKSLGLGKLLLAPTDHHNSGYGRTCGTIGLSFENHPRVLLSSNYVASPEGTEGIARPRQSVAVVFDPIETDRSGHPTEKTLAGTLSVSLNGASPTHFSLAAHDVKQGVGFFRPFDAGYPIVEFSNVHRKTDVVQWSLEQGGKVTDEGTFGFPVVGTVPKLIYYYVGISDHY